MNDCVQQDTSSRHVVCSRIGPLLATKRGGRVVDLKITKSLASAIANVISELEEKIEARPLLKTEMHHKSPLNVTDIESAISRPTTEQYKINSPESRRRIHTGACA